MPGFEFDQISRWLNLTDQQFEIFKCVYTLQGKGEPVKPREVKKEYTRRHPEGIQKSNLFGILKILVDRKLVSKGQQATYAVDFEGVKVNLHQKREELKRGWDEFKKVEADAEEYFKKHFSRQIRPEVKYLDHKELYQQMSHSLETATEYKVVANFPLIAYTHHLLDGLGTLSYNEVLWRRTLKEKTLKACYLTDFNVDYTFNHAFRVYGDPFLAYRECHIIVDQLENMVNSCDALDIRFLEDPHGLDVAIPLHEKPDEFYLFIRDEHRDISGGIYIKNPDSSRSAELRFMRGFEYAEKIQGKRGKELLDNIRKKLEQKYGVLQEK